MNNDLEFALRENEGLKERLNGVLKNNEMFRKEIARLEEENERLLHHEAWTLGLWATDRPDLFEGLVQKDWLFEITRTPSNKEIQNANNKIRE